MLHLDRDDYPYLEEVNEGALAQFPPVTASGWSAADAAAGRPRVLDIGCGQGQLGAAIRARGYEVWGIESAQAAVARAADRLDRVMAGDLLDAAAVRAALTMAVGDPAEPTAVPAFDALLFSDVLEHTYHPLRVLRDYLPYLRPGGRVVVSLPNVAAWEYRLRHLLGWFDYADSGVMDQTHVRFFTFRSAKALLRAAGCEVVRVDQTPYLVRAALPVVKRWFARKRNAAASGALPASGGPTADPWAIADSRAYAVYQRLVYPAEHWVASLWKGLLAFRIILVAVKPAAVTPASTTTGGVP